MRRTDDTNCCNNTRYLKWVSQPFTFAKDNWLAAIKEGVKKLFGSSSLATSINGGTWKKCKWLSKRVEFWEKTDWALGGDSTQNPNESDWLPPFMIMLMLMMLVVFLMRIMIMLKMMMMMNFRGPLFYAICFCLVNGTYRAPSLIWIWFPPALKTTPNLLCCYKFSCIKAAMHRNTVAWT